MEASVKYIPHVTRPKLELVSDQSEVNIATPELKTAPNDTRFHPAQIARNGLPTALHAANTRLNRGK
jgi:hypothetical protein